MTEIQIANRQRKLPISVDWLFRQTKCVLPLCLELPGPQKAVLDSLPLIEISLLSDFAMAKIHGRFLHEATPTDVITFPYGEILQGVETIAQNARDHQQTFKQELLRCAIHGLLHLNGYDDHEAEDAMKMYRRQEAILDIVSIGEKE